MINLVNIGTLHPISEVALNSIHKTIFIDRIAALSHLGYLLFKGDPNYPRILGVPDHFSSNLALIYIAKATLVNALSGPSFFPYSFPREFMYAVLLSAAVSATLDYVTFHASRAFDNTFFKKTITETQEKKNPQIVQKEIQEAIDSLNQPDRFFFINYALSTTRFTKAFFFNTIRSISSIALSIFLILAVFTEKGRAIFKYSVGNACANLTGTFISLIGIASPHLGRAVYNRTIV